MFLKESIRPGTSESMIYHICFTDHHHYGHLSHESTVAKYRGTVLGESLDFDKMERLILEKAHKDAEDAKQRGIDRSSPVSMEDVMLALCGRELLDRLSSLGG
jgi:hypothetical protein